MVNGLQSAMTNVYNCDDSEKIVFGTCSSISWNQSDIFSDNYIFVQKFLNFSDANSFVKIHMVPPWHLFIIQYNMKKHIH